MENYARTIDDIAKELQEATQKRESIVEMIEELDLQIKKRDDLLKEKEELTKSIGDLDLQVKKLLQIIQERSTKESLVNALEKKITATDVTPFLQRKEELNKSVDELDQRINKLSDALAKEINELDNMIQHKKDILKVSKKFTNRTIKQHNTIILATCDKDHNIKILDAESGECKRTLTGHTDRVYALAITADNTIVSGSYDRTIRIWNAETG